MTEEQETLVAMRIWSRVEEFGDCLLWMGWVNRNGCPMHTAGTNEPCTSVRRDVYRLAGRKLEGSKPIATTCGDKRCLNPDHIAVSTTKQIGQQAAKRGAWSTVARAAKIAASKRSIGKLDMQKALEIRMSTQKNTILSAEYGINKSLVSKIKRGLAWKDYSNPWAGLMR